MSTEETVVDDYSTSSVEEAPKPPKKTRGQLFRESHGYSITMEKLMIKHNCRSVEEYRVKRKQLRNARIKMNVKK